MRLLSPSNVKAYLNRSKNDANDAAVQGERKANGCALAWPGGNKPKGSQVPYVTITVPSGTVDAKIGATSGRVTLLSEETLRIEPDHICSIITATAQAA